MFKIAAYQQDPESQQEDPSINQDYLWDSLSCVEWNYVALHGRHRMNQVSCICNCPDQVLLQFAGGRLGNKIKLTATTR